MSSKYLEDASCTAATIFTSEDRGMKKPSPNRPVQILVRR